MPARSLKARSRIKSSSASASSRDKLKEHHQRVRFNARHPFHRRKKGTAVEPSGGADGEELGWALDQDGLHSAAAAGRLPALPPAGSSGQTTAGNSNNSSTGGPGSVRGSDSHLLLPLQSPASVGPVTPRPGGPDSVRSTLGGGGDTALNTNLPSVAQPSPLQPPMSNGPPTPFDALLHPKTPGTPTAGGGDHGPRSQPPSSVPSPYHHRPVSRCGGGPGGDIKAEVGEGVPGSVKAELLSEGPAVGSSAAVTGKRPALPAKDYEEEEEEQGDKLQSVYDYKLLNAWLSHPVKKFKGAASAHWAVNCVIFLSIQTRFAKIHEQSWARDTTVATTLACFQATKLFVIAILLYLLWLLYLNTEALLFFVFFLVTDDRSSISLSRCRYHEAKELSRSQLCS